MNELSARRGKSDPSDDNAPSAALVQVQAVAPYNAQDLVRQAAIVGLRDEMDVLLTERSIERTAELGRRARDLIGDDQFLATLALPILQGYVQRSVKRNDRGFGQ